MVTFNIKDKDIQRSHGLIRLFHEKRNERELIRKQVEERAKGLQEAYNRVHQKNKDMYDSLKYAKRLLDAMLPPMEVVSRILPEYFILNQPKDVISGDFYWVSNHFNKIMVAVMDCTGHGVPGALLSVIGHHAINKTVNELGILQPSKVLESMNSIIKTTLRQDRISDIKDGMDMALCTIDKETHEVEYSGANNNLYIVSDNRLMIIKACKLSIGGEQEEVLAPPLNHRIQLKKGDCLYIFSDGYAHQFGRKDNKKFNTNRFQQLLLSINYRSMEEQKNIIQETFNRWKGNYEQVDDVLVIGIRL